MKNMNLLIRLTEATDRIKELEAENKRLFAAHSVEMVRADKLQQALEERGMSRVIGFLLDFIGLAVMGVLVVAFWTTMWVLFCANAEASIVSQPPAEPVTEVAIVEDTQ